MTADLDRLGAGSYLLVTTFRKSGAAIPTPVWVVTDGGELLIWTVTDSGKIKRIRNNPEVRLAECDLRGNPHGIEVGGTARLLDAVDTERVRAKLKKKYGFLGWLTVAGSIVRRGKGGTIGVAITLHA